MFQDEVKNYVSQLLRWGQHKSVVGIDIGSASVKVVELMPTAAAMTLVRAACIEIQSKNKDKKSAAIEALKQALTGIDTKKAKIVCVVNCPQTTTRVMTIPPMPKDELAEALRWEIKDYIPFPIENAIVDFRTLGSVVENNVKKLNVLVAVSPKETIEYLLQLFAALEIKVSCFMPVSEAQQRLIALSPWGHNKMIAAVEMGERLTELNIYKDKTLVLSRHLPIAGNDITQGMTGSYISDEGKISLDWEEAERIKREHGIPSADETLSPKGNISPQQIVSLIRPKIEQLTGEIERSLKYCEEGAVGSKFDSLILYGGGIQLKGLPEILRNELDIEVHIDNPLDRVAHLPGAVPDTEKAVSHRLGLAIGAALSKAEGVNLLPVELKEETKRFIERISLEAVVITVIAAVSLVYTGMHIKLAGSKKALGAAQFEYDNLAPQIEMLKWNIAVTNIIQNEYLWEEILRELSHVVPESVYLTELKMKENIFRLKGRITRSQEDAEVTLSRFMLTLEQGIFENVRLIKSQKTQKGNVISEFEIECGTE